MNTMVTKKLTTRLIAMIALTLSLAACSTDVGNPAASPNSEKPPVNTDLGNEQASLTVAGVTSSEVRKVGTSYFISANTTVLNSGDGTANNYELSVKIQKVGQLDYNTISWTVSPELQNTNQYIAPEDEHAYLSAHPLNQGEGTYQVTSCVEHVLTNGVLKDCKVTFVDMIEM